MSKTVFDESVSSSFEQVDVKDDISIPVQLIPIKEEKKPFSYLRLLGTLSINLLLPLINGLMLGFGEILANEIGFNFHWNGSRVYRPVVGYKRKENSRWI